MKMLRILFLFCIATVILPMPDKRGERQESSGPQIFLPGLVCTDAHEFSCSYSRDMNEFYFTRGKDIYLICRESSGWSQAEPVSFNSEYLDNEPYVLPSGELVFGSRRPVEGANNKSEYGIWIIYREEYGWSTPAYLGQAAFVSSTVSGTIYTRKIEPEYRKGIIVKTEIEANRFTDFIPQSGGIIFPQEGYLQGMHPAISPDGLYMIFIAMKGSWGKNPDLFLSFSIGPDNWSDAINLSNILGIHSVFNPYISPDGQELFFSHDHDIYRMSTSFIENLKSRYFHGN